MSDVLSREAILLGGTARDRDAAITEAGRLLVAAGAVDEAYVAAMHERETSVSTFMGNGLAIPHGTNEAKGSIARSALSFVRYSDGVDWNGKPATFVVAIAGQGDDHLAILSNLSKVFLDKTQIGHLTPPEITKQGVEMVALCDRKPTKVDTPKKREIREKMFAQKYEAKSKAYLNDLRKAAMIECR